jgi:hypothetical protein
MKSAKAVRNMRKVVRKSRKPVRNVKKAVRFWSKITYIYYNFQIQNLVLYTRSRDLTGGIYRLKICKDIIIMIVKGACTMPLFFLNKKNSCPLTS